MCITTREIYLCGRYSDKVTNYCRKAELHQQTGEHLRCLALASGSGDASMPSMRVERPKKYCLAANCTKTRGTVEEPSHPAPEIIRVAEPERVNGSPRKGNGEKDKRTREKASPSSPSKRRTKLFQVAQAGYKAEMMKFRR